MDPVWDFITDNAARFSTMAMGILTINVLRAGSLIARGACEPRNDRPELAYNGASFYVGTDSWERLA